MVGPYYHKGAKTNPGNFEGDHIYPVGVGGSNDPMTNGQLITPEAHDFKTSCEAKVKGHGKSTQRSTSFRQRIINILIPKKSKKKTTPKKGKNKPKKVEGELITVNGFIIDRNFEKEYGIDYKCIKRENKGNNHSLCIFK